MRIRWGVALFVTFLSSVITSYSQTYVFGKTTVQVGPGAFSAVTGDFNGDGIVDLVSANQGNNTVSVVLGNAVGGFNAAASYATGPTPSAIIAGDFNNDGILDLAVANENCSFQGFNPSLVCNNGSVSILLGNGDGTFQTHVDYPTGKSPFSIAMGDINGDGKLDLVIANGDVLVLMGQGDGTFQTPIVYTVPNGAGNLVIGDVNNDHKLDIVIASAGLVTLLGKGDGTFQAPIATPAFSTAPALVSSQATGAMVAADFNLDGKLDLYLSGDLFLGNGDGTFVLHAQYSTGYSAAAVDLNGDGKPDLVIGLSPNEVAVFLGNGDASFQPEVDYGASGYDVLVADVNGDGKLDLVAPQAGCLPFYCSGAPNDNILVLLGVGDGTFNGGRYFPLPAIDAEVISADFNGDGEPDIAALATLSLNPTSEALDVFIGNGDGTFRPSVSTPIPPVLGSLAAADLNADGKADIAIVDRNCTTGCQPGNVDVLISNGDGTFQPFVSYTVGLEPEFLTIADFNGDTKPDLAVSDSLSNTISILLNNGNGTFKTHVDYPTGSQPENIAFGDFNGDGKLDLVVLTSAGISVHLSNGDGTFQPHVDYPVLGQSRGQGVSIAAGDFNQDGKLDLALTTTSSPSLVLLGNGDGTFQTPISGLGIGGDLAVADFNGDGKLDLISAAPYGASPALILLGNGDGTFGPYIPASWADGTLALADLNHDGIPDVIAGTSFGTNTTTQKYGIVVLLSAPFKAVAPASLHFGPQGVGTISPPQTLTLSNPASVAFDITNIVASSNFSQTNDCGTSLAAGAYCTITVSFLPSGTGSSSGSITVTDTTITGPVAIPLSGTGVNGPELYVSPTRISFSSQPVSTSSKSVPVTLVNTGNAALTLTGITVAGQNSSDFTQTNNCGALLAAGATCTLNVTFSPTSTGSRVASIAISGSQPGSPQTIALSGVAAAPPDFTVGLTSGSQSSQTITPGQNAQFSISLGPQAAFTGTVNLTCTVAPATSPAPTCSLSNSAVQLSGTAVTVTATVATTASTTAQFRPSLGGASVAWAAIFLGILLPFRRRRWSSLVGIAIIACAGMFLTACGSSSSSPTNTNRGTPAGTYIATVTAVSGTRSHSTTMTVVVH